MSDLIEFRMPSLIDLALQHFEDVVCRQGGVFGNTLYPYQVVICRNILKAFQSGRRFAFVEAPTGSGKSMIEMAIAICFKVAVEKRGPPSEWGKASMITVPTRELQRQFVKDYSHIKDVRVMMGMGNFSCTAIKDMSHGIKTASGERLPTTKVSDSVCQEDKKVPINDSFFMDAFTWDKYEKKVVSALPPPHMDDFEYATRLLKTGKVPTVKDEDGFSELPSDSKSLKKACQESGTCPYYHARARALGSQITVMSLQGYMAYNTFIAHLGMFAPREFTSFDECHRVDGIVRDFFTISKGESTLNETYVSILGKEGEVDLKKLKQDKKEAAWTEIEAVIAAKAVFEIVKSSLSVIMRTLGISDMPTLVNRIRSGDVDVENDETLTTVLKDWLCLKEALRSAELRSGAKEVLFEVIEKETRKGKKKIKELHLKIVPIALPEATSRLWGSYNLFLSATPFPSDIARKIFHVPIELVYVDKVKDTFPIQSRPIFKDYVDKITDARFYEIGSKVLEGKESEYKNKNDFTRACKAAGSDIIYQEIAEKLVKYADHFGGESGLVFVNGYKMAEAIGQYLEGDGRFVIASSAESNIAGIAEHRQRVSNGRVSWLISAGTKEGYDFKGDLCRIQVFVKMPFPPMDGLMNALHKKYKGYYQASVIQTLRQQYGRGMRGADDFCVTIILDEMFEKILTDPQYSGKLPREFHHAIQNEKSWKNVVIDSAKISY